MFSFDTKREPEKCIALRGVTFCLFSACKDAPLGQRELGSPLGELLSAAKLRGYPIKTSIPRFLPVENSLQLCYDRKQRIFPKIDSEEGNGSCVKVVF